MQIGYLQSQFASPFCYPSKATPFDRRDYAPPGLDWAEVCHLLFVHISLQLIAPYYRAGAHVYYVSRRREAGVQRGIADCVD